MYFDVVIAGAGPAGLACSLVLAEHNINTLIIERNTIIGRKVCAGGITWSGLIQSVPESLIECAFFSQHIFSRFQQTVVTEKKPLIATINREVLGQYMADQAKNKGVSIQSGWTVTKIASDYIVAQDNTTQQEHKIGYTYLVGADGSSSMVRRYLGIPTVYQGLGLHFILPGTCEKMEWHLDEAIFANGYGWVFPHKKQISIGGYVPGNRISAGTLKKNVALWAQEKGFDTSGTPCKAGSINYDYRGYDFGNIFLAGDAAGLASALTGEGLYPAIISGETVANRITGKESPRFARLVKRHSLYKKAVMLTEKSKFLSSLLMELGILGLKSRLIDFTKLEMST